MPIKHKNITLNWLYLCVVYYSLWFNILRPRNLIIEIHNSKTQVSIQNYSLKYEAHIYQVSNQNYLTRIKFPDCSTSLLQLYPFTTETFHNYRTFLTARNSFKRYISKTKLLICILELSYYVSHQLIEVFLLLCCITKGSVVIIRSVL